MLSVSAAAFRKRLSRARAALRPFTAAHCGPVSEATPCRCERRIRAAASTGRARSYLRDSRREDRQCAANFRCAME